MRIYIENMGESGASPHACFATGPRPDGGIIVHLTGDDLAEIANAAMETNHANGIILRFDAPEFDADRVPEDNSINDIEEFFDLLDKRARKSWGRDGRPLVHRVTLIK